MQVHLTASEWNVLESAAIAGDSPLHEASFIVAAS